jgi:hypothetical protein
LVILGVMKIRVSDRSSFSLRFLKK